MRSARLSRMILLFGRSGDMGRKFYLCIRGFLL